MKNEKELSERYFGDREIPSRRKMWDKIESLSAKVEEIQDFRLADSTKQHNVLLACYEVFNSLQTENQRLKQAQKQLAISELEKIYNLFEPYVNSQKDTILCANNGVSFIDYLDNQIKSLIGEE